jgi:hypothetical protein
MADVVLSEEAHEALVANPTQATSASSVQKFLSWRGIDPFRPSSSESKDQLFLFEAATARGVTVKTTTSWYGFDYL